MYYIYKHTRLDTNEVFYIGKGTKNNKFSTIEQIYKRAYSTYNRNHIWKSIIKKTEYKVDIVFETIDENLCYNKEIEYIDTYGRIFNNTGTLTNIAIGGLDIKYTKNHTIKKVPVFLYTEDGNFFKAFSSKAEGLSYFGSLSGTALSLAIIKNVPFLNYKWFYTYQGESIKPFITHWKQVSKKITISNEIETLTFKSIKETARFLNTSASFIRREINKPNRKVKGYSVSN